MDNNSSKYFIKDKSVMAEINPITDAPSKASESKKLTEMKDNMSGF